MQDEININNISKLIYLLSTCSTIHNISHVTIIMRKVRIFTHNSQGLLNDAEIFKEVFLECEYSVDIFKDIYTVTEHYDINLFLESIPENYTKYKCKVNMFMPNQEFFIDFDKLSEIDCIVCKTVVAYDFFKHIKKEKNHKYNIFYTKFTTNVAIDTSKLANIVKNPNLFIHLAGKSGFKGTSSLIYCWIKNNCFLDVDPNIKLFVTCYKSCYENMKKWLKHDFNYDVSGMRLKSNGKTEYKNITFFSSQAPYEDYMNALTQGNVAICVSTKEGFGHYINESRYYKNVIVTFDEPPMNELVKNNENGFLLYNNTKSKINRPQTTYKLYNVYPDIDELAKVITHCIKNKNNFNEMREASHQMFVDDKNYFEEKMSDIILRIKDM